MSYTDLHKNIGIIDVVGRFAFFIVAGVCTLRRPGNTKDQEIELGQAWHHRVAEFHAFIQNLVYYPRVQLYKVCGE